MKQPLITNPGHQRPPHRQTRPQHITNPQPNQLPSRNPQHLKPRNQLNRHRPNRPNNLPTHNPTTSRRLATTGLIVGHTAGHSGEFESRHTDTGGTTAVGHTINSIDHHPRIGLNATNIRSHTGGRHGRRGGPAPHPYPSGQGPAGGGGLRTTRAEWPIFGPGEESLVNCRLRMSTDDL